MFQKEQMGISKTKLAGLKLGVGIKSTIDLLVPLIHSKENGRRFL